MEQVIEKLVAAAQSGDADSFSRLVDHYLTQVYRVCLGIVGNKEDAEDCAQETWIKVYRTIGAYQSNAAFFTWLYRIAVNTCYDMLRASGRRRTISLDQTGEDNDPILPEPVDPNPLPDEVLERQERISAVREEIAALPEDHRHILILRDLTDVSYQDLAQLLDIAEGTVKSRLSRARRQLAQRLQARMTATPANSGSKTTGTSAVRPASNHLRNHSQAKESARES